MSAEYSCRTKRIPPPIPAFSLLGGLSPLLLGPVVLVVAMALFAPVDVLDSSPAANAFTHWMSAKLPFMTRQAESTIYPQVALLVNCLMVALMPALGLVWMVQTQINYPKLLARNRATRRLDAKTHLIHIFITTPFVLFMLYVMVGIAGDPSWANGFTTHHRGGLAFLSGSMLWLMSMALGSWPFLVRLFVDLHIRKET
jgi:hypothetical protein